MEEARGQTAVAERREQLDEDLQQDRRDQSPLQQQQLHVPSSAAELRKEQQRNRPALALRDHRDGRVRAIIFQLKSSDLMVKQVLAKAFTEATVHSAEIE